MLSLIGLAEITWYESLLILFIWILLWLGVHLLSVPLHKFAIKKSPEDVLRLRLREQKQEDDLHDVTLEDRAEVNRVKRENYEHKRLLYPPELIPWEPYGEEMYRYFLLAPLALRRKVKIAIATVLTWWIAKFVVLALTAETWPIAKLVFFNSMRFW